MLENVDLAFVHIVPVLPSCFGWRFQRFSVEHLHYLFSFKILRLQSRRHILFASPFDQIFYLARMHLQNSQRRVHIFAKDLEPVLEKTLLLPRVVRLRLLFDFPVLLDYWVAGLGGKHLQPLLLEFRRVVMLEFELVGLRRRGQEVIVLQEKTRDIVHVVDLVA